MAAHDLVIFDCDGVVIDSEAISAEMLVSELRRHGVAIDLDYVARHFLGRSYPVVLAQIRRDFGLDLPPGFDAAYRARLLAAFETRLRPMPGIAGVVARLAVPRCIATSSSPARVARSLQIAGLGAAFGAHVFTASEVAHGKPAPDLFLHAAARMGADPARCLVIEDSLNGIRAGLAAGMEVWQFTGGSHMAHAPAPQPDAVPHRRFASFAEFFHLAPDLFQPGPEGGP